MLHTVLIANRGPVARMAMDSVERLRKQGLLFTRPMLVVGAQDVSEHQHWLPWLLNTSKYDGVEQISSYSAGEEIVAAARRQINRQANLVFPGYGYTAEDPAAARACEREGITWVGPSSEILEFFGDKLKSRQFAEELGVPVIPGASVPVTDPKSAMRSALEIIQKAKGAGSIEQVTPKDWEKYPIRIKAVAGGGGRGQRVVTNPDDFEKALEIAAGEIAAFSENTELFLELNLTRVRHLEVQIIGDGKNVYHLGARNCSIQTPGWDQKLIEEAVYPGQTGLSGKENGLLENMIADAVKIMKAIGYKGVGTVEFMVTEDGNYYFLEVNPRLQVEHPVTEMISRIQGGPVDLIGELLKVAIGMPLSFTQDDITFQGSSIEARIVGMCFDSQAGIAYPYPVHITGYNPPKTIPGRLRLYDGGLTDAFQGVGSYRYQMPEGADPMFAQLVVWENSRLEAIDKLQKALLQYRMYGDIKTTIPFTWAILNSQEYRLWGERAFTDFTARFAKYLNLRAGSFDREQDCASRPKYLTN